LLKRVLVCDIAWKWFVFYERIQDGMFSYVSLEQRVPQDPPLRAVRKLTDAVLQTLSTEFDALYADSGRPSVARAYILRNLRAVVGAKMLRHTLHYRHVDQALRSPWLNCTFATSEPP
jgi:hypothetical protein